MLEEFTKKNLDQENLLFLGHKLKEIREKEGLPLERLAQRLTIRLDYLRAIENDECYKLPSGLYGKNYVKRYAKLLKIPNHEILSYINQKWPKSEIITDPFSKKIVDKKYFIVFTKLIRNALLLLAALACFSYLIFYLKKTIFPPELVVWQPETNIKTTNNYIKIKGWTENEASVSINGETVLTDKNGYFTELINLKKGLNNLTITAQKKYGQDSTLTRQILVE